MPSNYTRKRRIGAVRRPAAAILGFQQTGSRFLYNTEILSRSGTTAQAVTDLNVAVPIGIVCRPIIRQIQQQGTAGGATTAFGDGSSGNTNIVVSTTLNGQSSNGVVNGLYRSSTSAEVAFEVVITSGTISANQTFTLGWYDDRGQ